MPIPFADLTPPYVLLENRLANEPSAWLYRDAVRVIRCDAAADLDGALAAVEAGLAAGHHTAGFLAYELGRVLEPGATTSRRSAGPLLWFGLFPPPDRLDGKALDAAFAGLGPPEPVEVVAFGHDRATHVRRVSEILRLIRAGDVYQVNLTFPISFQYRGDPQRLYGALRAAQAVAHGGLIATGRETILSVSPELWIETRGDIATTRPMKGTSPRGKTPTLDRRAAEVLAGDPKQRAENLMIVDLLRNDLARISRPGTVAAPALFTVETYPTFHTLTSTVTARLRPGVGLRERIGALFPCGSIVGAPKIRADQIIAELEDTPRGIYCGALGAIAPDGDMTFSVAIRTAVLTADGVGRYGVGGGIVADSDPDQEYSEALLKGRVLCDLADDYRLIETFRLTATGVFVRLDRHLDRLAASADQLGFVFDRARVLEKLDALREDGDGDADRRVRVSLARAGRMDVTHGPLPPALDHPPLVGLATHVTDPADPFLRHKTDRRRAYERAFETGQAAGFDEVIFCNRRGEVTEGSRSSLFVEKDGRLLTPPVSAGLLPGVLRGELLDDGRAEEAVLTMDDLLAADVILLGSSLRGLRPAIMARAPDRT